MDRKNLTALFAADLERVDELKLSSRQKRFLRKIRLFDPNAFVSRTIGKLLFRGPVIGVGAMPMDEEIT
jgi:hypothetical protein